MAFSIMTQNCFGVPLPSSAKHLRVIASKIIELQPDVVFLQEIQWLPWTKLFDLRGYQQFYEDSWLATKGGLLTLVKDQFQAKNLGFNKFYSQGKIFSLQIQDCILGKGFIDVYLESLNIHLINTHLVANYDHSAFDQTRVNQLTQLFEYTKNFKRVILAGDFNLDEKSDLYNFILKRGFKDFTFGLGPSYPDSGEKLDFIFGFKTNMLKSCEYINYSSRVSDHNGILIK